MDQRVPNKTDKAVSDFFHSKTWKTLLTIWLSAIGIAVSCVGCLGLFILFGWGGVLLTGIAAFQQLLSPTSFPNNPVSQASLSTPIPIQTPQGTVQQPRIILTELPTTLPPTWTVVPGVPILKETPTSLPFSTNNGEYYVWTTTDIPLYGFTIDLMQGWYLTEKRLNVGDACGLGHDLANYIVAPMIGSEIDINFLCGARGWAFAGCPDEIAILDESRGIVRVKVTNNEYLYEHYSKNQNVMECVDGWKITDNVAMMADYKVTMGPIELPIVDRIILSVHNK